MKRLLALGLLALTALAAPLREIVVEGADPILQALARAALPFGVGEEPQDLEAARRAILETGYFSPEEIARLAEAAIRGGADFLKTSTGFGPRGASLEDVALLVRVAQGRAQVKAAGGIRDREPALRMLKAGASRLGTSSGVALVAGEGGTLGY